MEMYLLQRGKLNENTPKNEHAFLGMVDLDYMGSSEFEWGALPKSMTRIMCALDNKDMVAKCLDDIKNTNGVPMWIICKKNMENDIHTELHKYVYDMPNRYSLKEYNSIPEHCGTRHLFDTNYDFIVTHKGPEYKVRDNFWWDIENDFFAFFGAAALAKCVMDNLEKEHTEWWLNLPEEEVKQKKSRADC